MAPAKTAKKDMESEVMGTEKTTSKPVKKSSKTPVAKADGFAVIATGGKQYQVAVGETIKIEKMKGEYKKGDVVTFESVLLTSSESDFVIGTPAVSGAIVTGEIVDINRAPKVVVIKYKQKSRYQKKNGHRQPYFAVKITAIA